MKIEIKKLTENKAEEKIDINIKTWWTTYKGLIPDDAIAKLQVKTQERIEEEKKTIREKNNTYGIYVDNKLVGYSSFGPARDKNYKDSCEIYSCYILEEYQRLHLGRKVVIKILEDFINEGYKTMITKCLVGNPSNKFHEAIGGKYIKTGKFESLGYTFPENIYYHDDIKKSLEKNKKKEF
ncbi:MAG TPA: GNAT family N-acetyltransferase [Candidatus Faecimonas gallistercoris]|nr:GNAT family N-acetyltransferase [Candidatus Faecimonas gallistercoris]